MLRETGIRRAPEAAAATEGAGPAAGVRWDLSHLYASPDDPGLEADLDDALAKAERFDERYRGNVAALSAAELVACVDDYEALQEPISRVASYAQLLYAADTATPRHGALLQHVQERATEIRNHLLFFELEWVAVDEAQAKTLLADPDAQSRRHFLEGMRRYRPHVLTEPEERLMGELANTGRNAFGRLFDEILANLVFSVERGDEKEEMSEEEVLSLLYSPDRETRRAGAASLTEGLRENARTLGFIFNTLVQDKAVDDRLRHYESPLDARNLSNEIESASVRSLIDTCVSRYDLVARYYGLKAKLLGEEQLFDYDRYAPIG